MKLAKAACSCFIFAGMLLQTAALADEPTMLSIESGHSMILTEPHLTRVAVGDGQIAGVVPIGTRQVIVNGKFPGRTTIFIWAAGVCHRYEVRVDAQGAMDTADLLRAAVTYPNVSVLSLGNTIIVRGTVDDPEQYAKLSELLARFDGTNTAGGTAPAAGSDAATGATGTMSSGTGNAVGAAPPAQGSGTASTSKIINVVTVLHPLGNLDQELSSIAAGSKIRVDPDTKGNLVVSGLVQDRVMAERVLAHVRNVAGPYLAVDGKVIDRLEPIANSEIDIKVAILEVDKTAQHNLGLSLESATASVTGTGIITYTMGDPIISAIEGPGPLTPGKGLTFDSSFLRTQFFAPTLSALINDGHARMLNSPDLVTLPGTEATFLVGGQIPYIVPAANNTVTIEFKQYGVQLNVTPTILPNGSIQALITPDVSALDFQNAVKVLGYSVPALTESKLSTTAIARPGQSIIMGGLVQRVEQTQITKYPFLGNLPILGALFRSTTYQSQNSDIVFVMTPQIVNL